jgi:hypothetical protein
VELDDLKKWAHHLRSDLPTDSVIDALVEQYRGPGTVYSSDLLAQRVHADAPTVLATLMLLSNEPHRVLKGYWLFFDEAGEEFPLSPDDVADAIQGGEFFHPLSGLKIFQFQKAIGLVHEADEQLAKLAGGRTTSARR